MHISTINAFFRKTGEKQIKYRWIILFVFILVRPFAAQGFQNSVLRRMKTAGTAIQTR